MSASDHDRSQRVSAVSALWSRASFTSGLEAAYWLNHPAIQAVVNRRASGEATVDWLLWLGDALFGAGAPARVLVLGCGGGWVERFLAERYPALAIDAQDLALGAVTRAVRGARRPDGSAVARHFVSDLERAAFPRATYDAVIAHSVLHHVAALEGLRDNLIAALRPDGVLIVNEYCGPDRLQYTAQQLALCDELLASFPESHRWSHLEQRPITSCVGPDAGALAASDPSESVRSSAIPQVFRGHLVTLIDRPLGGTLLSPLLYDLIPSFRFERSGDVAILLLVAWLEEVLIGRGRLGSDYWLWMGSKSKVARTPAPPPPKVHEGITLPLASPVVLGDVPGQLEELVESFLSFAAPLFDLRTREGQNGPAVASGGFVNAMVDVLEPWLDGLSPDPESARRVASTVARVLERECRDLGDSRSR